MRVRFTPSAEKGFLAIIDYIRRDDRPIAAERFRQRAEKALRRLEIFPNSGRPIPEFPELSHREVIVPPYRFFYKVEDDDVWIVDVWHGAQLPIRPR